MADAAAIEAIAREYAGKFPDKQPAVLAALHHANSTDGHITPEAVEAIAAAVGVTAVRVWGVATFYTMYNQQPVGKYLVQVCTNISCSLRGSYAILTHLEKKLNVKIGATTPDLRYTLIEVECLGACGGAPAMQINDDYHENLTTDTVDEIIARLT
ncbi:MAG: NADH-quinone oxidoreductase subunit NuoE [Spirochaetota bacterium]